MKPGGHIAGTRAHSRIMTRTSGILFLLFTAFQALGQGGDAQLRAKADALFAEGRYAEALRGFEPITEPAIDNMYTLACLGHLGETDRARALRTRLENAGHTFFSETDTEVLAHLIGECDCFI